MERLLNVPEDMGHAFRQPENTYFHLSRVEEFDVNTGAGRLSWLRHTLKQRASFNQVMYPFERSKAWEFPAEYGEDKSLPFDVSFVSERVLRLRISAARPLPAQGAASPMIERLDRCAWNAEAQGKAIVFRSGEGSLHMELDPVRFILKDRQGRTLTQTRLAADKKGLVNSDPMPTCFVRQASDFSRRLAFTAELAPGEAIVGLGESFTALNKRGQRLNLWMCDPKGVMGQEMYKPVPFWISSEGYGVFVHTSAPVTVDIGQDYSGAQTLYVGDDSLDLFFFIGTPRQVLADYTHLTGQCPVPPLWSFGLWMSRITYRTQEEALEVASKLRELEIPCDVIHLDTGWFEVEWRCDYRFSLERFPDHREMLARLREQGFRTSIWQMPYFNPNNALYPEIVEQGYAILDSDGRLPTEDAVLDFSNSEARAWYQGKLRSLIRDGVAAVKADFGEGAPLAGHYASGRSGRLEHNLYPLRYTQAVQEALVEEQGEGVLWARSAWAGGQRYPVHWGGDCESTDAGMAATLRGGLSLGLSGFSFWSHDNGGFVSPSDPELYLRWLAMGMFTSHTRCHGQPPKEPWHFGEAFSKRFREIVSARYRLMPYLYTQAVLAAGRGLPMLRALCVEYPDDLLVWCLEDEYLFGDSFLVAPLLRPETTRSVYLPRGNWVDYQTGLSYGGGCSHVIEAGRLPIVLLVKEGSAIPHIPVAQHTGALDWGQVTFRGYGSGSLKGVLCLPEGIPEEYQFAEDQRYNNLLRQGEWV